MHFCRRCGRGTGGDTMNHIRKLLAALLAGIMLLSALPMAALAEELEVLMIEQPAQEIPEEQILDLSAALEEEEESETTGTAEIVYVLSEGAQDADAAAVEDAACVGDAGAVTAPVSANICELADFAGVSIEEMAARLGMSVEEALALSEEESALHHAEIARQLAYVGDISLDIPFSGTANTSSTQDYNIKITRSGRYLLKTSVNKYLSISVYCGSERIDGVGHLKSSTQDGTWAVDLEAGNTYTFKIAVDSRYNSGSAAFTSTLRLYTDGSVKDRAESLAYDVYADVNVKYANDFRVFNFTAVSGSKYRITTTGNLRKRVEVCDSNFKVLKTQQYIKNSSFEVTLDPGKTYYLLVHGMYLSGGTVWYETGSGSVKIECLDKLVDPITVSASKKSVNPGTGDSIKFSVKSKYASKVRLILDGDVYGDEVKVSGGKASIKASFHTAGTHQVQVQGYYNNAWSLLSEPIQITVKKKEALPTPSFSSVINNAGTTGADQNYVIHWYKVDGADQYIVNVQSGDEVIYTDTVSGTSITIPGSVLGTLGMYVVDVYGIGKNVQQSKEPASAKVTVENRTIRLSVSTAKDHNRLTWTAEAENVSANAQFRFDLYNSATGLVQQGSFGASRQFSYTTDVSGEFYVIAWVKDAETISVASETIRYVKPKAQSVVIYHNGADAGKSMNVFMDHPEVQLSAVIAPFDASQDVKWSSSNKKIAKISADGKITPVKSGKVTITATAKDGSKKKDSITITVKRLVKSIEISGKELLASSFNTTLKAKVLPANATNKSLKWSSSDTSIATVNAKGVVTAAKGITERKTVVITASAKDGSGVFAKWTITVCPKVSSVQMLMNGADAGKSAKIDLASGISTLQLGALVQPANAIQDLKWTSSNKSVASVDADGLVKGLKPGTVTITVSAKDGTGKKDTISVTVARLAKNVEVSGKSAVLTSGQKTTLKAKVTPANTTSKAVKWTTSDASVAKVNTKGVVTACKVSEKKTVTITATAKDGSGVYGTYTLTVLPKAAGISLKLNGAEPAAQEEISLLKKGQILKLSAQINPAAASQDVKWSSSNTKIAKVDIDGTVTLLKTGTVTITAAAKDGSGKTAKIKLKIS